MNSKEIERMKLNSPELTLILTNIRCSHMFPKSPRDSQWILLYSHIFPTIPGILIMVPYLILIVQNAGVDLNLGLNPLYIIPFVLWPLMTTHGEIPCKSSSGCQTQYILFLRLWSLVKTSEEIPMPISIWLSDPVCTISFVLWPLLKTNEESPCKRSYGCQTHYIWCPSFLTIGADKWRTPHVNLHLVVKPIIYDFLRFMTIGEDTWRNPM